MRQTIRLTENELRRAIGSTLRNTRQRTTRGVVNEVISRLSGRRRGRMLREWDELAYDDCSQDLWKEWESEFNRLSPKEQEQFWKERQKEKDWDDFDYDNQRRTRKEKDVMNKMYRASQRQMADGNSGKRYRNMYLDGDEDLRDETDNYANARYKRGYTDDDVFLGNNPNAYSAREKK